MSDKEILLMLAIAVVIALALIIPIVIADKMRGKKTAAEAPTPQPIPEDTELTAHARVVDMSCGVETVGHDNYRAPKLEKDFAIAFETDAGERLVYHVEEDVYDGFEIGLAGMLSVVKGKLDSFVPDECSADESEGEVDDQQA